MESSSNTDPKLKLKWDKQQNYSQKKCCHLVAALVANFVTKIQKKKVPILSVSSVLETSKKV